MIKYIYIFLFFIISTNLPGQDAIFSQFYHNPLYTSASLTGIFNGKYRIGTSFRNQSNINKGVAYYSKSVFADFRYNLFKDDFISLGIIIIDDHSGINTIGKSNGYFSFSYSKHLTHNKYDHTNQYLVFGIQSGFGKTYIDNGTYLFGIQFDKILEKVDPNIPNGENAFHSILYPDINMGLMWYYNDKYNSIYAGFNILHLNSPNISFIEGVTDKLSKRMTLFIGGQLNIDNGLSILPALYANSQNSSFQTIIGTNFRYEYYSIDENAFRIGLWARVANSIDGYEISDLIVSSILEFNRIEIGLSYDISISNIHKINDHKGAFELSLMYTWGKNPKHTPINCPKF